MQRSSPSFSKNLRQTKSTMLPPSFASKNKSHAQDYQKTEQTIKTIEIWGITTFFYSQLSFCFVCGKYLYFSLIRCILFCFFSDFIPFLRLLVPTGTEAASKISLKKCARNTAWLTFVEKGQRKPKTRRITEGRLPREYLTKSRVAFWGHFFLYLGFGLIKLQLLRIISKYHSGRCHGD